MTKTSIRKQELLNELKELDLAIYFTFCGCDLSVKKLEKLVNDCK